jgi:hypothetical protein
MINSTMAWLSKQQICAMVLVLSTFSDVTAGIDLDLASTGTWEITFASLSPGFPG